ncbi:MAG: hypothetical protein ACFFDF_21585 [Candidatus Odinarchaeota archaeon]
MSFWTLVKKEISRIANLKDPEKALEELKKLDQKVNGPKIKTRKRGNYIYFYVMNTFYDSSVKEGRRKIKEKLGRISIEKFESNKKKIKEMSSEELKNYLEKY